jgi:hypothetical protein
MSDFLQVREFVQVKFTLTNWADFDWNFVFRQIASINQSIERHSLNADIARFFQEKM